MVRGRGRRARAAGALTAAALLAALLPAAADAEDGRPLLTLDPIEGPCGATVTARGEDFPPGAAVTVFWGPLGSHVVAEAARGVVGPDGTFAVDLRMPGGGPFCTEGAAFVVRATAPAPKGTAGAEAPAASEARYWVRTASSPPADGGQDEAVDAGQGVPGGADRPQETQVQTAAGTEGRAGAPRDLLPEDGPWPGAGAALAAGGLAVALGLVAWAVRPFRTRRG